MIKDLLHAAARRIEMMIDSGGREVEKPILEPYAGYATPEHLVVRGRVLAALRRNKPEPTQSVWINFRQMVSLFLTDEVSGVEVSERGVTGISDEEGYFTLLLPRQGAVGWVDVEVNIKGRPGSTTFPVLIASKDADFGVISDIDDTMLETGAYSLARNLWTSMTGNALSRRIFPDAVAFMTQLGQDRRNPVYYVSSSPWNLHHFLRRIFDRHGLVQGPTFLRDLGVSKTKFITGSHGDHKGASIDLLMAANPALSYVLVGDTGQHDAHVYRDVITRHPDRVRAVVLREPGPGPDAASTEAMDSIEAAGVPLFHGSDFTGVADAILARTAQAGVSAMRPASVSNQQAVPSNTATLSGLL